MDSIYLQGAENVSRAGSQISQAADEMQQAARNIEGTLDMFLRRLEAILEEDRAARITDLEKYKKQTE